MTNLDRRSLLRAGTSGIAALTIARAPLALANSPTSRIKTGSYTYPGPGSVNTHWIETPNGVIVIDVQRDLTHAREALAAVRRIGKPVLAVLVTHAHPDHYAGLGLFKEAFPNLVSYSSAATLVAIRTDHYGFNALMQRVAPGDFPNPVVLPERTFADNATLTFDGVEVITREMGRAEANSATVFYVPESGDLYAGDLVLSQMHGFFYEKATSTWLSVLDRMSVLFPRAATLHPGHGPSGRATDLISAQRAYMVAARTAAALAIAEKGIGEAAQADVAAELRRRFATYGRPAGLENMIELSTAGLFEELSARKFQPVK